MGYMWGCTWVRLIHGTNTIFVKRWIIYCTGCSVGTDINFLFVYSMINWWWSRFPLEQYYHLNFSVIYFEIFTISTSDCDISMRTCRLVWFFYTKKKNIFKKKFFLLQLARSSCLLVHAFVFSIEFRNEHPFSLFSELVTVAVNFFYYWYFHITLAMSPWIKVFSSHFIDMFVSDIS